MITLKGIYVFDTTIYSPSKLNLEHISGKFKLILNQKNFDKKAHN